MPEPPADLHPEVKAQWDRAGALLLPTGVLTTLDGYALLILVRAAADYLNLFGKAPPGSDVLATDEGKLYWNPFAAARDKAEARLLRMLAEFGLTPVSREKIRGAPPADETDPFEALLNGAATSN